jgi:hypothetical protein
VTPSQKIIEKKLSDRNNTLWANIGRAFFFVVSVLLILNEEFWHTKFIHIGGLWLSWAANIALSISSIVLILMVGCIPFLLYKQPKKDRITTYAVFSKFLRRNRFISPKFLYLLNLLQIAAFYIAGFHRTAYYMIIISIGMAVIFKLACFILPPILDRHVDS